MSRVIEEHRTYLRDRHRLSAYERALREVVKPGDVVVDLASGTGILGMLACRAGAARVYAIEEDGIAGLARQLARANGLEERITGLRGHSQTVTPPERADVVVCDQIGGFGLEAGILDLFQDARARFLRPGGTMIPCGLDLMVAPVEHRLMHGRLRFWKGRPADFDCGAAAAIAANTGYPVRLRQQHLLSAPVSAIALDLTAETTIPLRATVTPRASRDGVLHGFGGWFVARLAPHVTMTNSPLSAERILRRQVFFPIEEAVPVEAGATIEISVRILPSSDMYAWEVSVRPAAGTPVRFRHSTLRGMLIGPEDLRRTHPEYRPRLTRAGDARMAVLRMCDGRHSLQDIEQSVYDAYRDLFASRGQAATFVTEVVSRYSRA